LAKATGPECGYNALICPLVTETTMNRNFGIGLGTLAVIIVLVLILT